MSVDDSYLAALGRERAQHALAPAGFGRVMMVDAHLAELGYGADDQGNVRKLPKVERAEVKAPEVAVEPKRRGRPPRERAVDPAPERVVDED